MNERLLGVLLAYGVQHGLIPDEDVPFVRNRLIDVLRLEAYDLAAEPDLGAVMPDSSIDELLRPLLDDAASRGLISPDTTTERDLWDTAIMGCFVARPSTVVQQFWNDYARSPVAATDAFHRQAVASNYIRVGRTDRNITWRQPTEYGVMDMTINVSKPEKDPRDIAAAARSTSSGGYPLCLLCRENEGYAGRVDHPARQNLRLIPMDLAKQRWYLQYSPYRYYNEHCIVLSEEHRPMRIDRETFARLAEFTEVLPHYMVGSNADLPIVGGSILSHDHFQGGRFEFAMDRARSLWATSLFGVEVAVLHWPLSVLRVTGSDEAVIDFCDRVLGAWRTYTDEENAVFAFTNGVAHNTIAPIARRIGGRLRMDLVLRNNRTSRDHPDGVFHPHAEIHSVKKENIGLIEVMGLAVLPGRLEHELAAVARALVDHTALPSQLAGHQPMLDRLRAEGPEREFGDALERARLAAGAVFVRGLEHCGVFGADPVDGCGRLLETI